MSEPKVDEARITGPEQYLAALRRVNEALRARKAQRRDETRPEQEGGAK